MAAALPPCGLTLLGWVCLVPLLMAVRGRGLLWGFLGGLLTLFVTCLVAQSGVFYERPHWDGEASWIATSCMFFGFAISITAGAWGEDRNGKKPLWWFAALAVSLEACLLVLLPGHLALTQHGSPFVLIAAVGGIWMISFFLWWVNLWLTVSVCGKSNVPAFVASLLILVSAIDWRTEPSSNGIRVALIQTETLDRELIIPLHEKASSKGAGLVIWPEYSGAAMSPIGSVRGLKEISSNTTSAFVTTFSDDTGPLPHNVAVLFTNGEETGRYAKRKLFGSEAANHIPGSKPSAASLSTNRIGLNICFDSCFPWVMRDTAQIEGVNVIALPNLDPESPHHFLAAVHSAFTSIRAAELGMPIVRADVRAHSMIVNAWGQIITECPPDEAVVASAVGPAHPTPARYLGDWFLYLCVLIVIGHPVFKRMQKQRTAQTYS
ncbi:MAG: carbon-nitrogen hydrolase family protein [Fimbriimonadaceae bacterium]|nr:carbon-nitrogen hydrolase family protein [Fimbriimonadaceae bacterium]